MSKRYEVLVGVNYPTKQGEKRAEPGDVVDDLPAGSVQWLVAQGVVSPVKGGE